MAQTEKKKVQPIQTLNKQQSLVKIRTIHTGTKTDLVGSLDQNLDAHSHRMIAKIDKLPRPYR